MARRRRREEDRRRLLHGWPDATLDLHGMAVDDARTRIRNFLMTQSRLTGPGNPARVVRIVTGKGTGRLFLAVGELLEGELARWIDASAPEVGGAGYRVRVR